MKPEELSSLAQEGLAFAERIVRAGLMQLGKPLETCDLGVLLCEPEEPRGRPPLLPEGQTELWWMFFSFKSATDEPLGFSIGLVDRRDGKWASGSLTCVDFREPSVLCRTERFFGQLNANDELEVRKR